VRSLAAHSCAASVAPVLASLLKDDAVAVEALHARYGSMLQLVRALLGVVPNAAAYMEIWPPAFRSYNVLVPNFVNLPFLIWGFGAPRELVGLSMYAASRAAGCAYCSAHTCTFALRRGTAVDSIARAVDEDLSRHSARERAVIEVARGVASVPPSLGANHKRALQSALSDSDAEWMVLAAAMMGFLNKLMDSLGVELEAPLVGEVNGVIAPSGWVPGKHFNAALPQTVLPKLDTLATKLGLLRHAPGAIALERSWTAGVPDRWPQAGAYLAARTGHDFPILARLRHRRAIRSLTMILRDNLDASVSVVGIPRKLAAGATFATVVGNTSLHAQLARLGVPEHDPRIDALARAVSTSPVGIDAAALEHCKQLPAAAIIEVLTFIAVLQLVHRLECYYAADP